MATISVTIPDDKVTEVREAFATRFGWTPELGVTKTAFAKQMVADYVKSIYQNYVIDKAIESASLAAKQSISTVDIS